MKSPSLDKYYQQIDKAILLVERCTEIKELSWIIKSCRLKPSLIFFKDEKYKLKLYDHWFDEFGNSLKIIKNKKLKIISNDLSLDKNKIVCTDLYYGLSFDKIIKISKLIHLIIGKDDEQNNIVFLTFLGIDNYLRSYLYYYNEWKIISPLLLGRISLINIFKFLDIKYFLKLYNKENIITPCATADEWICCLPVPKTFWQTLKNKYDIDLSCISVAV